MMGAGSADNPQHRDGPRAETPGLDESNCGQQLEIMSSFFIEHLRMKDPVKAALALHDQGIKNLRQWAACSENERVKCLENLRNDAIVAGDRSKLRKITNDQIKEWRQIKSKLPPPLPTVLPQQRQSKEEMEVILSSYMDEVNMTRALVGLGMRGVYGGARDIFLNAVQGKGSDSVEEEATESQKQLESKDIEIQSKIYRACEEWQLERQCLDKLLKSTPNAGMGTETNECGSAKDYDTKIQQRLIQLDRKEAMAQGKRACLNPDCEKMEQEDRKFEICSRCKIAGYCCRECQIADWKRHSKLCNTQK
eukprot:m.340778 g.340778  ORF g.340778 m.340778 type:complete len:308 (+) comp19526_c0_seq1:108-1031(+)